MEPWSEQYARHQKKGFAQKAVETAVILYAGFAICIFAVAAEAVTIPLARRFGRRNREPRE